MNTPARIESLLWMASPMAAWAQASALPTPQLASEPHKRTPVQANGSKAKRKRKATA